MAGPWSCGGWGRLWVVQRQGRALGEVLSFTCAVDPSQKYLWGTLGAQVIDMKQGHLPQKGLWQALGEVLSFTCACNPLQKYL